MVIYLIYTCRHIIKKIYESNLKPSPKSGKLLDTKPREIGMVVPRHNESVKWLIDIIPIYMKKYSYPKINLYLYIKGDEPLNFDVSTLDRYYNKVHIEKLKNVGMGNQTYFYHIVKNYDNLEDLIFFIQGTSDNHIKKNLFDNLLKNGFNYDYYFTFVNNSRSVYNFTIDNYTPTGEKNHTKENTKVQISPIRPFGKWYEYYTGKELSTTEINYKDIFSLSSTIIRKLPPHFYETLNNILSQHIHPEAAHYVERMWYPLYSSL